MTEGQEFFLILCLLYLSESVLWVKPQAWVFLSGWWGQWKASEPTTRGGRGRLVMAQWLPPLGWGFVCGEGPVLHAEVSAVRTRIEEFQKLTARLHGLAACLVLPWFFALIPLAYWRVGATLPFWVILATGWLALGVTSLVFFRAHRRVWPGRTHERWQHTLLTAIVPQHAIRVPGLLARHWLSGCHPLAVAAAVLTAARFTRLASKRWRELAFPRPGEDEGMVAIERAMVEAILREARVEPASLLAPPAGSGGAVAYCPRCHVLFQDAGATCADCGGLAVIPLPS